MTVYDYTTAGFDKFLRRGSVVSEEQTEDNVSIQIPQVPVSSVKGNVSKESIQEAVGNLVQITGTTTVSASVDNGDGIRLTSTLTDNDVPTRVMMGICEVAAYQDTIGSSTTILPYGSDTIAANYKLHTVYDYHQNQLGSHPGSNISYTFHLQNESGVTHTIYYYVRWRYLGAETAS